MRIFKIIFCFFLLTGIACADIDEWNAIDIADLDEWNGITISDELDTWNGIDIASVGTTDYTTDAVGAWRMDGDDGTDEVEPDEGPNSYDLAETAIDEIVVSAVRPPGYSGNSRLFVATDNENLSCVGTDSNCANLDISGADQDMSICVWFNPVTASESTYYYLGGKYKAAGGSRQYALYLHGTSGVQVHFVVRNSADTSTTDVISSTSVSTGTFYLACGVYDDSDTDNEAKIYVNGGAAEDTGDSNSGGIADGDQDFCWGAAGCNDTPVTQFDGYLYQGLVRDDVLSQADIQAIYDDGFEGNNGAY